MALEAINIEGSDFLKKVEEKAINIFMNKEYSDINVQDAEGNTFLHYAARANSSVWVEKILRQKANPNILNNQGFHAVRGANIKVNYVFIISKINLDDNFLENTKDFSPQFVQIIFDTKARASNNNFKTIEECENFLKATNLFNDKNIIKLISNNIFIGWEDKLSYYMKNWNEPEKNTYFLKRLISAPDNKMIFDISIVDDFLQRNFEYNDTFREVLNIELKSPGEDTEYSQRVLTKIIDLMFRENFDFQYKSWGPTVEEDIYQNKIAKKIYLKEKLEHTLAHKDDKTTILKI